MKVTEVACVLGAWTHVHLNNAKVMDIGFGTGLLSLMLAQRFENISIEAIEIDQLAFEQGADNILKSPFSSRLKTHCGDIRKFDFNSKFDFIICNPPFFEQQLKSPNENKNKAWHASELSISELLQSIKNNLNENGQFSILFPMDRKTELEEKTELFKFHPHKYLFIRHSEKHDWKFFIVIFGHDIVPVEIEYLTLKNNNQRSEALKVLLAEFYLNA